MSNVKYKLEACGRSMILDKPKVLTDYEVKDGKEILNKLYIIDGNNVVATLELVHVLDSEVDESVPE